MEKGGGESWDVALLGGGCCTNKGVDMPTSVNTGGKAEAKLKQTLETGGGYDGHGSPRWR